MLDRQKRSPRDNLLAIFDDAKSWFGDVNFHGCLAVNTMGEYAGKNQSIEQACLRFKQWEIGILRDLPSELGAGDGEALAYGLFVLFIALVMKGAYPVDVTAMAEELIGKHDVGSERRSV